ncbi:transcriptional regulator [Acinetobacter chinensis]|jgi:DNA-binding HxlR family transcriptional regulator|uniref:Transcriptional regulator n=1 Tax=Acinetobacter chinensis TaxID=2004650 RepID=A0A3B7LUS1_9GAMM|nr:MULTISPECIES: helix-turn-helix domain-containing protein [Acinetobacter]AXY55694.1 transcriptional regulator [Acinetobacter chinensis]AXY61204.1 transcriptional regulator [Acinetobacter sp. WCHAc010052]WOE42019.1 helix-turn-helix domain-containing protein [Acinetobacter chinensis]
MSASEYEQHCSIMRFIQLFSGKWVLPIIYHLIHAEKPVRFNELHKALSPVPQKELSRHLKLLEKHQLISRTVYAEIPPKVEYQITELGRTLEPSIESLSRWMLYFEQQK